MSDQKLFLFPSRLVDPLSQSHHTFAFHHHQAPQIDLLHGNQQRSQSSQSKAAESPSSMRPSHIDLPSSRAVSRSKLWFRSPLFLSSCQSFIFSPSIQIIKYNIAVWRLLLDLDFQQPVLPHPRIFDESHHPLPSLLLFTYASARVSRFVNLSTSRHAVLQLCSALPSNKFRKQITKQTKT